jgi:hypothetical protein
MNRILLFILLIELLSSAPIKPKFCCDCKFFMKDFFITDKFGKCSLFPKEPEKDNMDYLVDGIKKKNDYNFCSIARNYEKMCGSEGNLYEKK